MQSVQSNLVNNDSPREQNNKHPRPVVSIVASETAPEKAHLDQQLAAPEALFTWLFGSGCY